MHEIFAEILGYIQGATRYKWLSLLVAWVLCLAGWTYISQMPDEYKATARVHVDTRSVLKPLLSGLAIHPNITGQVRLMTRLMFTRPNLEKIARMTDLDLNAKDDAEMDELVARLKSSMRIKSARASNIFAIAADDPDPKVAKRMVQSLLTIFVEDTLGESRKDADSAQRFLDQQIKEYEMRLMEAEKRREEFKRQNIGLLSVGGGGLYNQMQGVAQQLEQANLAIEEAINRRDEIKRQLEDEDPVFEEFGMGPGVSLSPIELRIQELQQRIDELLLNYTEAHPSVFVLKNAIAELEKKKLEEDADMGDMEELEGDEFASGGQTNPVFQQLRMVLTDAEANVASLRARVANYEKKIETLKEQLDARLKIETKLKSLNRDYSAIQSKYSNLVSRRETARLSDSLEQNTETVKFRIVDPPRVPLTPSGPNRILYSSGVLGVAILVGLGLAILLTFLRPTFSNSQKVRDVIGLPVLGTISMNWIDTVKKKKWHGFLRFCAVSIMLLLVFSTIIVLEIKGVNLYSI